MFITEIFICSITFIPLEKETNLKNWIRVCGNKDFCNVILPSKDIKILEFHQYQKSDKAPFIIYADPECLRGKPDGCKNNPEISFTTKVGKHICSSFSMSTISWFKSIEISMIYTKVKIAWKSFVNPYESTKWRKIILKRKKMKLLTKEQQESYENAKTCYICKETIENIRKKKDIVKLEIIFIIQGKIGVLRIAYVIYTIVDLKKCFHDGSNYDYHLIIKVLAEEFEKQIPCFGENTEKYLTFTVPIEKEVTRIDKNGEEITKNISYILQFIDSARFMVSSLSNLVNNLSEEVNKIKCKYGQNDKKCDT